MIELNNLILNASTSTEFLKDTGGADSEHLLDLETLDTTQDQSVDPNSFVLFLAQVLSLNNTDANAKEPAVEELASIVDETKADSTEEIKLEGSADTAEVNLDNNIALAWINSESYNPPKTNELLQEAVVPFDSIADKKLTNPNAIPKELAALINETNTDKSKGSELAIDLADNKQANADSNQAKPATPINAIIAEIIQNFQGRNPTPTATSPVSLEQVGLSGASKLKSDSNNADYLQDLSALTQTLGTEPKTIVNNPASKMLNIPVPINNPQWADQFSDHVVWLGQQSIKSALIKINPEDLGPIEISIKMVKDSASVTINSHSAHVCSIVDQSMSRLRDMMAYQGLDLAEVEINLSNDSQNANSQGNNSQQTIANNAEDEVLLTPLSKKPINKGLIDYFA